MKIIHFHRKPRKGFYSIENIYESIREELKDEANIRKVVMPFTCRTHIGKMLNVIYSAFFVADVYHITGDCHYIAALLPKSKTVITAHCVEGVRGKQRGLKGKLFRLLYFVIPNRKCSLWTTVSNDTKEELIDYIACENEKIKVVYNPLYTKFKDKTQKNNVKRKSDDVFIIFHQGTHPRKNLENVIRAVEGLDVLLVIKGGLSEEIKSLCVEKKVQYNEIIKYLNEDDLVNLYLSSDLVEVVSLYESFGMSIIEAQALGIPVITSDIAAMPEVAGGGACLVDPTDVSAIRREVIRIMEDGEYRKELVERGKKNVERFGLFSIAREYLDVYRVIKKI